MNTGLHAYDFQIDQHWESLDESMGESALCYRYMAEVVGLRQTEPFKPTSQV